MLSLREELLRFDYTYESVLAVIGEAGLRGLTRNSTIPADIALGDSQEPLATLIKILLLQRSLHPSDINPTLDLKKFAPFVTSTSQQVGAEVAIHPYASPDDNASGWLVFDRLPGLDCAPTNLRSDHVLGASPASQQLAQLTIRRPVGRALDLGTGCGVQSLHLARHCEHVIATDLNPRALELAQASFRLSNVNIEVRSGSLYEPVAGETFDLIVSNPPYVMSPPSSSKLVYREGNLPGDELVRQVIVGGIARLNPGGTLQVLANWAIRKGEPWQDRIQGWLRESGCAAHVVLREKLDIFEYIEIWLSDAGLQHDPHYLDHYRRWLAYFAEHDIEAVGMGWINVRKPRSGQCDERHRWLEEWPHAVNQPVGPALDALLDQLIVQPTISDLTLLSTRWHVSANVDEERIGEPGAEHPRHIVLRQRSGMMRAELATTALAATVGACDGDLSLGAIITAVADLLNVDGTQLRDQLLPTLRRLVRDGFLLRHPGDKP